MANFLRHFKIKNDGFKPDYDKENAFRRIIIIHTIGAFIIGPLLTFFIVTYADVSDYYYYLGISYTLAFPIYALMCWFIEGMQDKLYYLLIGHYFILTYIAFLSLLNGHFSINELFCFLGVYTVGVIFIQRLYSFLLYVIFVLLLMIYAFMHLETLVVSKEFVIGLLIIIASSAFLVLLARMKLLNEVADYADYLKKVMDNPGVGYILFDHKRKLKVVDYNVEINRIYSLKKNNDQEVKNIVNGYLSTKDLAKVKALKIGQKFTKNTNFTKFGVKQYIEVNISILSLKNKDYFLARIVDITEDVYKREELKNSEKKYRNLYYKNRAGVFTVDRNSMILNGNDSFFQMFEHTVSVGDPLFTIPNKDDWDIITESLGEKETSHNYQTQFTLTNGQQKIFIFSWYLDASSQNIEGSVIDLTSIQKTSQALRQSEEKYRLIYEESNDAILLLENDKIIDVNRKTIQLFGVPQSDLLAMNLYDLSANISQMNKEDYEAYIQRLSNSRSIKFNWLFKRNKQVIEAEVTLIEIMLGNKLFYQCVIQDKTEQNKNLRAIKKNQKNLENILENNPEGILIVRNQSVLYSNPEMDNLIGSELNLEKLFIDKDQVRFNKALDTYLIEKKRKNIQLSLISKENEELLMDVTLVSTNYEEEEATLIIMKDVSVQNTLAKEKLRAELAEESNKKLAAEIMERIKTERLLEEQYLRTKAILDSSSNTFLITLTLNGMISSYNTHSKAYFSTMLGRQLEVDVHFNNYFKETITSGRLRLFNIHFYQVSKGTSKQFEIKLETGDKEFWLEIFMNPIFDTEGAVAEISLVAHDISDKKKTSIEIEESLKEKEVLLKEIHHRVKNNLQVISSILNLQSSFVEDEKTLSILQESRNRIRSMAIIHENLYRTEDFSSINFSEYLNNLTGNLISSYRIHEVVVLDAQLDDVDLILDQAIPCGLLVNELITNALKYAWQDGEKGTIKMKLYQKENVVFLEISDDGKGLPVEFEEMKSDTLGLQMVVTLVEQLDGEIKVDIKNGTKYLIKFDNIKPLSDV